jgi:hypothetical protein
MAGPIILVVAMVLLFPPVLFGGGLALAAGFSWVMTTFAERAHEGSEVIELNR